MANKIVREIIHAKGIDIGIYTKDFENEYISLTDIAKYRNDNDLRFVIQNWMRNRNTVEFLAVWEELHNLDFNRVQFEAVRSEAGLNMFVMTPTKWIEQTNAIGIVSKAGRYGYRTDYAWTVYDKMCIRRPMMWRLFCSQKMEKVGWDFNEYPSLWIKPKPGCHDWYRDYLISSGVKKKLRGYKYHTEKQLYYFEERYIILSINFEEKHIIPDANIEEKYIRDIMGVRESEEHIWR